MTFNRIIWVDSGQIVEVLTAYPDRKCTNCEHTFQSSSWKYWHWTELVQDVTTDSPTWLSLSLWLSYLWFVLTGLSLQPCGLKPVKIRPLCWVTPLWRFLSSCHHHQPLCVFLILFLAVPLLLCPRSQWWYYLLVTHSSSSSFCTCFIILTSLIRAETHVVDSQTCLSSCREAQDPSFPSVPASLRAECLFFLLSALEGSFIIASWTSESVWDEMKVKFWSEIFPLLKLFNPLIYTSEFGEKSRNSKAKTDIFWPLSPVMVKYSLSCLHIYFSVLFFTLFFMEKYRPLMPSSCSFVLLCQTPKAGEALRNLISFHFWSFSGESM